MERRSRGSIVYKEKRKLYYGVVDLGRDSNGRRSRKWTRGFEKRRDAERALAKLLATGSPTLPGNFTVVELIEQYINHAEKIGRQPTTVERYRSLLRSNIVPIIGQVHMNALKAQKINAVYDELRERELAPTTIVHVNGLLSATFNWAIRIGRIDRDPMVGVQPPRRARSNARAIRPDEARRFFAWLEQSSWARWRPMFLFSLATGMRRGEVLALRDENVDLTRGVVIVAEAIAESRGTIYRKSTKTEEIRELPLSALAIEALTLQDAVRDADRAAAAGSYEDHDLVFADPYGRWLRPMAVTDAFRRAADGFGLQGCTLHTLRHTAATWLLAGGADVRTTSSIMGHADASTTLRIYSHVVNERQRAAIDLIGDVLKAPEEELGRHLGRRDPEQNKKRP